MQELLRNNSFNIKKKLKDVHLSPMFLQNQRNLPKEALDEDLTMKSTVQKFINLQNENQMRRFESNESQTL